MFSYIRSTLSKLNIPILVSLIFFTLFASFQKGLQFHQDQRVLYRYADYAIPTALSYLMGHPKDYTGYSFVNHIPFQIYIANAGGYRDAGIDGNAAVFNRAMKIALSSEHSASSQPFAANEDIGLVDFTYMAFLIFGVKVESIYYFYFLLIVLSAINFVICFYGNANHLMALAIYSITLFGLSPFYAEWMGLLNPRVFSIISMIGVLQVLILISENKKQTDPAVIITTIFQLFLLTFVYFVRSPIKWQILLIIVFSGLFSARVLYAAYSKNNSDGILKDIFQKVWPVIIILMLMVFLSIYTKTVPSEVYRSGGFGVQHLFWHQMRWGSGFHPHLSQVTGYPLSLELGNSDVMADLHAVKEVQDYLKEIGDKKRLEKVSPKMDLTLFSTPNAMDWDIYEQAGKETYFYIFKKYPLEVLANHFYFKPKYLWDQYCLAINKYFSQLVFKDNFAVPLLFLSIMVFNLNRLSREQSFGVFIISGMNFLFSLIISIVVAPIELIRSETYMALMYFLYTAATIIFLWICFSVQNIISNQSQQQLRP